MQEFTIPRWNLLSEATQLALTNDPYVLRRCNTCQGFKPVTDFSLANTRQPAAGRRYECKRCVCERAARSKAKVKSTSVQGAQDFQGSPGVAVDMPGVRLPDVMFAGGMPVKAGEDVKVWTDYLAALDELKSPGQQTLIVMNGQESINVYGSALRRGFKVSCKKTGKGCNTYCLTRLS